MPLASAGVSSPSSSFELSLSRQLVPSLNKLSFVMGEDALSKLPLFALFLPFSGIFSFGSVVVFNIFPGNSFSLLFPEASFLF